MPKRDRPDREDYFMIGLFLFGMMTIWSAYAYQACGAIFDECTLNPLKEWQPIIASIIASLAASFTIIYIRKQITQTAQIENHRRKRRVESQKPFLAHALAIISNVLSEDILLLIKDYEETKQNNTEDNEPYPKLNWNKNLDSNFEIIRDIVEYEDSSPAIGPQLSALVIGLQIYRSRRYKQNINTIRSNTLIELITDNLKLQLINDSLYEYARNMSNTTKEITRENITNLIVRYNIENKDKEIIELIYEKLNEKIASAIQMK